jgi:pre-rRNA-processing protein TSR3
MSPTGAAAARSIPILIVRDHRENVRKCTLSSLEGTPGVSFIRASPRAGPLADLETGPGILLDVNGPCLAPPDARFLEDGGRLIILDSTWARLPSLHRRLALPDPSRIALRSLPRGIVTAYPRVSKVREDPRAGLASIEALFAALFILGSPRPDFLAGYRWAEEFLGASREVLGASPTSSLRPDEGPQ